MSLRLPERNQYALPDPGLLGSPACISRLYVYRREVTVDITPLEIAGGNPAGIVDIAILTREQYQTR